VPSLIGCVAGAVLGNLLAVPMLEVIGGVIAVPAGVYLHLAVVPVMAHAANSGYPASVISVYTPWSLLALGVLGC
jgi:putative ABC transport system permease protein